MVVTKCDPKINNNPEFKGLKFYGVKCAPQYEVDKFINSLQVTSMLVYNNIDISEKNISKAIYKEKKLMIRHVLINDKRAFNLQTIKKNSYEFYDNMFLTDQPTHSGNIFTLGYFA